MAILPLGEGQAQLPTEHPTQSFWHTEPSPILLGRKSKLPVTADVVIVGSGITGAFAARHLKQHPEYAGKRVVMLEAREACWGATGRNGGHCQPSIYIPPPHIAKFELDTFKLIDHTIKSYGIDCDWVATEGVHALMTQDLVEQAKARMDTLKDHPELSSLARLVTNPKELEELRIPSAKAAVVQKNAAALWPYKLVAFLLEQLIQQFGDDSFSLQTNTPVHAIQCLEPDTAPNAPGDRQRSWAVHTSRGQIAASKVLLCCNGYISHLLPEFTDLVYPVRAQVAALRPPTTLKRHIGHSYVCMWGHDSGMFRHDYLIERGQNFASPPGELLFGGGREYDAKKGRGISDDGVLDETVASYLRGGVGRELDIGTEEDLFEDYQWAGIMGYSRDGFPWVGQVPKSLGGGPGLWVCGGYSGHGMPVGPRCGQGVVDMMIGVGEASAATEIPPEFLITEERVKGANSMDIYELEEQGFFAH